MEYRTETDLLGDLQVPKEALYGVHTARALDNFQISKREVGEYKAFVKAFVVTKKACALANLELGVLDPEKGEMILRACDHILEDIPTYCNSFPVDVFQGGAGTSVNMNVNEVIANVALRLHGHQLGQYDILHPNDHVNKSQSTNDSYPTAFRVAIIYYVEYLTIALDQLASTFDAKGAEYKDVLKMGRTQLQDAVPMSLGDEFNSWAVNLREEIKTIEYTAKLAREINLGGTAIGTGVNAPVGFSETVVRHLSILSGHKLTLAADLIEASSDCGAYVMISGALKRTAVKLSKICNDLRLLSSGPRCGLNEINLPEMQAGSSIMPAKVNPVIPEVVNQVCFKIIGNDVTISFAAEGGQLQLNVMEPVIVDSLFESFKLLTSATRTLQTKCVRGITANTEHTKQMVLNSVGLITYLTPHIGHHMGDVIGKEAIQTGKSVRELVLEKELLSEEILDKILSPENLMDPRLIRG